MAITYINSYTRRLNKRINIQTHKNINIKITQTHTQKQIHKKIYT